eukprot:m.118341 g.118341  ORF g.118341 m.118341 type:complete len:88 (+) comp23122_c0_seq1:62-325(+)
MSLLLRFGQRARPAVNKLFDAVAPFPDLGVGCKVRNVKSGNVYLVTNVYRKKNSGVVFGQKGQGAPKRLHQQKRAVWKVTVVPEPKQ